MTERLHPDRPRVRPLPTNTRKIEPDEGRVIPAWYDEARCKTVGPATFYSTATARALRICAECPVLNDCRAYALEGRTITEYGVWGGLTQEQRNQYRLLKAFEQGRLKPHVAGTEGAYQQHRRNREAPCALCKQAHAALNRKQETA